MKRALSVSLVILLVLSSSSALAALSQSVQISSSPNPVGSGARAMGMGGAFIGVADDATAASWNPGGLIQLETPELSIVGAYDYRREDTTYKAFPEASGPQSVTTTELNYLSGAYPFEAWGKNMIVSLNFQHLYDFNKKVSYRYTDVDNNLPVSTLTNSVVYDQTGAFKAVSPAFAIQVTPQVSLGMTLNFWDHGLFDNKWSSNYQGTGFGNVGGVAAGDFTLNSSITESYKMSGMKVDLDPFHWENVNYHFGAMWNLNSAWTLGAVFKAPFEARLNWDYHFRSQMNFYNIPLVTPSAVDQSGTTYLMMPMSLGTGLAHRASDALTFDLDVYWTQWSKYVLENPSGTRMNPITGKLESQTSVQDTVQVRFGGEYLFIGNKYVVPLRAGVFYDPEPSEGAPDNFFGGSIGSGITIGPWVFDAAYQYRFGRDVRSVKVGNDDSSQDVDQHSVFMSLIYHF